MEIVKEFIIDFSRGIFSVIESYQQKEMTKKDVILVSTFLCLCHAIIEDTLLFMAIGANPFIIVLVRVIVAIIITLVVRFFYERKHHTDELANNENELNQEIK
ncbi:MAG: hypothetical protein GX203_06090 [Acholeplasmataceae bacterium]|nr:hypothetical protein [Acholeplasmataceae bacterium]